MIDAVFLNEMFGDVMGSSRMGVPLDARQPFFRPRPLGFLPRPIFFASLLRWAA